MLLFLQVLEQLNVFAEEDVDSAAAALDDVSSNLVGSFYLSSHKLLANASLCIIEGI